MFAKVRQYLPEHPLVRWTLFAWTGIALSLLACEGSVHWLRLAFVGTTCIPIGLYQLQGNPYPLHDGEMVQVLLPSDPSNPAIKEGLRYGWITKGQPWIKIIAALPGQTVVLKPQGVWVNGKHLPNSRIRHWSPGHSHKIIHYPYGTYSLTSGQVWLYAPGNYAFDSAYYGPVPETDILQKARPWRVIQGSQYWLNKGE